MGEGRVDVAREVGEQLDVRVDERTRSEGIEHVESMVQLDRAAAGSSHERERDVDVERDRSERQAMQRGPAQRTAALGRRQHVEQHLQERHTGTRPSARSSVAESVEGRPGLSITRRSCPCVRLASTRGVSLPCTSQATGTGTPK